MKLPIFTPMPSETAALLPVWDRAVVQAQDLEGPVTFLCPVVASQNGSTLLLGLAQERTAAGHALVRALWFDQPVTGPVFRELLEQARRRNPAADLAVIWELMPTAQSSCSQPPQPEDCPLLREEEVHLELLRPEQNGEQ